MGNGGFLVAAEPPQPCTAHQGSPPAPAVPAAAQGSGSAGWEPLHTPIHLTLLTEPQNEAKHNAKSNPEDRN